MMKYSDLANQNEEDLSNLLNDLERELFTLRNRLGIERKVDKPHLIKENRRNKARILTALSAKKNAAQ
ncbi:MAG: 50S ribosomal protein L29 [Simkaniaceae bacterium]